MDKLNCEYGLFGQTIDNKDKGEGTPIFFPEQRYSNTVFSAGFKSEAQQPRARINSKYEEFRDSESEEEPTLRIKPTNT